MKKNTVRVYDTISKRIVEVEVSDEVRTHYNRTQWNIDDNNESFYKHEIQFSALIGGYKNAFENFHEFQTEKDIVEKNAIQKTENKLLYKSLSTLSDDERNLIIMIYFENKTESECASLLHTTQQNIHKKKRSIEYLDNRVSLYAAQYGKCAVTGRILWIDEIHCHHKKPTSQGGTDEYNNLVIVHKDVHMLIHAVKSETIQAYLDKVKPDKSQLEKINKFRMSAGNPAI